MFQLTDMSPSDMEYVNCTFLNSKQHTIAAHRHLPNLLEELFVLRRYWKASRYKAELSGNACS